MQEQTKETRETINIYDTKTRTDRSGTQNTKWGTTDPVIGSISVKVVEPYV